MEKDNKDSIANLYSDRNDLLYCPIQKVLRANQYGLLIQTHRAFEVGEEIKLGFHLPQPGEVTSFISATTLVVDSRHCLTERGNFRHQVTLLFCDISDEDRSKLLELTLSEEPVAMATESLHLN